MAAQSLTGVSPPATWHCLAAPASDGSLPLKTRSFLDYCVPRLRIALADLLPADVAVLTGDLSSS
jgi:hypothetical protein